MAYNQNQAGPFWDFVRSLNVNGQQYQPRPEGVDHAGAPFHPSGPPPPPEGPNAYGPVPHGPGAFPFGGPGPFGFGHFDFPEGGRHGRRGGWGGRGRGRHGGRRGSRSPSPGPDDEARENPESGRESGEEHAHRHHGRRGREHGRRGRGGPHGGFGGPRGAGAPFDLSALLGAFAEHPIGQALRGYAEQSFRGPQMSGETVNNDSESSFVPPIDVFNTARAYVLHVALPGAKKEDVGINWDADKGELNVAGVVYRGGDEEFLKALTQSERKVGVFERNVKLPPSRDDKDEVDGDAITARLEDGVLIVTVPKVEKEWTEVKRVDIL